MEISTGNNSTHEESSKVAGEEEESDSNQYPNRITRNTLAPNYPQIKNKNTFTISDKEKNKNNETLPIKRTISTFNFKVVIIGNVSVGKSSIIKRYISNEFSEDYKCTIGTESFTKSLFISENKKVNLKIWDTCGQERFRTVTRQYYQNTQAILLVFDLTNEKSFTDLDSWLEEVINYISDKKCMIFLLGNKSDEKEKIVIDNEQITKFLQKNHKIKRYFDVSALNGHNIDLAFDKISQYLAQKFGGEEINKNLKNLQKLDKEKTTKKEKSGAGCC
jgi:small GTP-binding protein